MRFLHAADVHLDSPMRGLPRSEWTPSERLRGATRRALTRLVDLAVDLAVDFVVVAGDLYDGDRDDFNTAIFLQRQLHRLREAGIPVVIALGNHDAANEITRRLEVPEGTSLLPADRPGSVELAEAGAAVHGQSYPTRAVLDDLTVAYPSPVAGALNVGVLHTALDGRPGHDPYAPCTREGLVRRGYDYWALGHVHTREDTERDGVHVVFPGNLQGRHANERGAKGATLVDYDGGQVRAVEAVELAPVRFERVEVDASTMRSADEALEAALSTLGALEVPPSTELVAARLVLRPSRPVARRWLADRERLEAQLRADGCGDGERLWLERIELRPPDETGPTLEGDAVAAVQAAVAALRRDPGRDAEIAGILAPLRTRLGSDLPALRSLVDGLLDEAGTDELLDRCEALLLAGLEGDS